ncbi:protein containing DUF498 [Beggiatoa sp. PS]|nr:protein containing DUF498 [Beggiatoa sp. PS]
MKLHLDQSNATYQIQSVNSHSVTINNKVYSHNLILMPEYLSDWAVDSFDNLNIEHFKRLRALQPEMILLGTGSKIRFPAPELLAPLMEARIGIEVMDMQAACRTYSILMTEGRTVAVALLFE